MKKKITYSQVGDNYDTKDPIKKLAQNSARETGKNLEQHGFSEITDTRGESAYVWQQGNIYMASVIEGLGTKNLVADAMYKLTGKSYYDIIAHDTVATIINDLVTVGAAPLTVHAYWAVESNEWLADTKRMTDFITGWKNACDISGASWGGGETPTLKGVVEPGTVEVGGSAVGIIKSKKRLITDKNLKAGDRIILLKSNGINANGLSLARAVAKKLSKGYITKMPSGTSYGDALLTKTNIYARLVQNLLDEEVDIHYIANITGHGLRKVMRARENFIYVLEKIFEPQELFLFIQKHAGLSDFEMYQTFNMGNDYALFISVEHVERCLKIVEKNKFKAIDAGVVKKVEKQLVIKQKSLVFAGDTLDLR